MKTKRHPNLDFGPLTIFSLAQSRPPPFDVASYHGIIHIAWFKNGRLPSWSTENRCRFSCLKRSRKERDYDSRTILRTHCCKLEMCFQYLVVSSLQGWGGVDVLKEHLSLSLSLHQDLCSPEITRTRSTEVRVMALIVVTALYSRYCMVMDPPTRLIQR